MKKGIYTLVIALIVGLTAIAQSGQKFASNGNSLSTGEFLGSTNAFPLIFKTNNTQLY